MRLDYVFLVHLLPQSLSQMCDVTLSPYFVFCVSVFKIKSLSCFFIIKTFINANTSENLSISGSMIYQLPPVKLLLNHSSFFGN
jgi:hypothetical protein